MPFLVLKVISWKPGREYSTILQYKKYFKRILCGRYVIYKPAYKLEKADESGYPMEAAVKRNWWSNTINQAPQFFKVNLMKSNNPNIYQD